MSSLSYGSNVPDRMVKLLKLLLGTIENADYQAFLAPGTMRFQKGISKAMFVSVSVPLAARLKEGYSAAFQTELKQGELRTFLWKISFRHGGDEYIARLAVTTDDKVAGFLIN